MIGQFVILAGRIRRDLPAIEQAVARAERSMRAARTRDDNQDLFVDSAALNLHDFYSGCGRLFEQIASIVDQSVPSTHDWHRELLRQMTVEAAGLRPQVLSNDAAAAIDEYLRFRHVVRNVYAFNLDPERVRQLAANVRPVFDQVSVELRAFADFLDAVAQDP